MESKKELATKLNQVKASIETAAKAKVDSKTSEAVSAEGKSTPAEEQNRKLLRQTIPIQQFKTKKMHKLHRHKVKNLLTVMLIL